MTEPFWRDTIDIKMCETITVVGDLDTGCCSEAVGSVKDGKCLVCRHHGQEFEAEGFPVEWWK